MFRFASPTEVIHGPGTLKRLPDELARLGAQRVLVVSDRGLDRAGLVDRITTVLAAAEFPADVFLDVPVDPTFDDVDRVVAAIDERRADAVVSLGSGSVMAAGRSAALAATNGGRSIALADSDAAVAPPLLSVCVPTTAGSGGEVSRHATITHSSGHKSGIHGASIAPRLAILDAELLLTVPARQAAASGVDALTHALEAYVSRRATPWTDALAVAAFETLFRDVPRAIADQAVDVLDGLLVASAMANVACGNAGLGLVHGINMGVTYLIHRGYPGVSYGDLHAILLPWVWRFNAPASRERHARLAALMGVPRDPDLDRMAAAGESRLRGWLEALGEPNRLPWDGCPTEDLDAVSNDVLGRPMTRDNPRVSSADDIQAIVRQSLRGW